jgi:lipoprotein-releasing system permease protein
LNLSYFIAKRISGAKVDSFSGTIYKIAVASIGIGLAVMIISFQILQGFQQKIQNKIISFAGHLQVTKFTLSESFEEDPISRNAEFFKHYQDYGFITHVQEYAHKAGLIKANDEVLGIVLKGIAPDYDVPRFEKNIVEGRFIQFNDSTDSKEILISRNIASKLDLRLNDDALVYFIQNPIRVRKLKICGIYETGLEDFDERVIIGDLKLVQKINNWPDSLVGGFEVFVDDFGKINKYEKELAELVSYDLYVEKISDKYMEIFDWLSLLNRNVAIFLTLTLAVASFNMISILLILIMERTQMIGILKALGTRNKQIRKIFIYNGMFMIAKGLLLGNIIGVGFGLLQDKFRILTLNPENYYMKFVPIWWNAEIIIGLNILIFIVVTIVLLLPTAIISRISPIKSIRFD